MPRTSTNMISGSVTGTAQVVGTNTPGDSYYGFTDGLHTEAIYPNNFKGNVEIQATLAETPTSADWFNISLKN